MIPAFIDTNILLYHLLQEHTENAARCTALLDELSFGRARAACSNSVIAEAVYVLEKSARVPRQEIVPPIAEIVAIPALQFEHRDALLDALDFWLENPPLSFADCYHLALASHLGLGHIYTFDKKMGRYPGVERIEP